MLTDRDHRNADLLFAEDGSVRLPRLAPLALGMALRTGGPVSNQPTEQRAQAVADAVRPLAERRRARVEVVAGCSGSRWLVHAYPE